MQTPLNHEDHMVNPEGIKMARDARRLIMSGLAKAAFIPGGDPSMGGGGGGGGAPPPDPSGGGGGAPPMDPSGGGGAPPPPDPSGGGGAPPPGGGGGGDPVMMVLQQILSAVQGGGMGGGQTGQNMAGGIKPKIDVNVALMQIAKMLARIADSLGVKIPASEMIATPTDLNQIASKQQTQGTQDMAMAGAGPPGGIQPMSPMPGMEAGPGAKAGIDRGSAFPSQGLDETMNKAAALIHLRRLRKAS